MAGAATFAIDPQTHLPEGMDPNRYAAFRHVLDGASVNGHASGEAVVHALRATNGVDKEANITFARQVRNMVADTAGLFSTSSPITPADVMRIDEFNARQRASDAPVLLQRQGSVAAPAMPVAETPSQVIAGFLHMTNAETLGRFAQDFQGADHTRLQAMADVIRQHGSDYKGNRSAVIADALLRTNGDDPTKNQAFAINLSGFLVGRSAFEHGQVPSEALPAGNSVMAASMLYDGAGAGSQSPLDMFAQSFSGTNRNAPFDPNDPAFKATRAALQGADPEKVRIFMVNNAVQLAHGSHHEMTSTEIAANMLKTLQATGGVDGKSNTDFAHHIRAALNVALDNAITPAAMARFPGTEEEKKYSLERAAVLREGMNRGLDDYISSQKGGHPSAMVSAPVAGAPNSMPGDGGWRRSFNTAVLKGIDDIEAGHATVAETKVVQQALVDQRLDLGKTGAKTHNGVDGDARTLTLAAIAKVKTRTPGAGPGAGS